jgi:hypothetical protein
VSPKRISMSISEEFNPDHAAKLAKVMDAIYSLPILAEFLAAATSTHASTNYPYVNYGASTVAKMQNTMRDLSRVFVNLSAIYDQFSMDSSLISSASADAQNEAKAVAEALAECAQLAHEIDEKILSVTQRTRNLAHK